MIRIPPAKLFMQKLANRDKKLESQAGDQNKELTLVCP